MILRSVSEELRRGLRYSERLKQKRHRSLRRVSAFVFEAFVLSMCDDIIDAIDRSTRFLGNVPSGNRSQIHVVSNISIRYNVREPLFERAGKTGSRYGVRYG